VRINTVNGLSQEVVWSGLSEQQLRSTDELRTASGLDDGEIQPNALKRTLLRLGFPQFAFSRNIPKATRYFWFKCGNCKKIANDYAHGYARYFTCPHCGNRT